MLPASATVRPMCPRMAAARVAVVLFPLVPVTASTGRPAMSSSHTAIGVVTVPPRASTAASSGR